MANHKTFNTSKNESNKHNQSAKPLKPNTKVLSSGAKNVQRDNFARYLADHGDKARARREAQYKSTANEYALACRMSNEEDIVQAVNYYKKINAKRLNLRTEAILGEIHSLAFSNMRDFWEWDEKSRMLIMKDITQLPRDLTAAIQSIRTTTKEFYDPQLEQMVKECVYELKLHNKWQALKHIADLVKELKPFTQEQVGGTERNRKVVELRILPQGGKPNNGGPNDKTIE